MRADLSQGRRRRACIGRTQPRPAARERTNHRKPRVTQPENENALAFPFIAHLPCSASFQPTKAFTTETTETTEESLLRTTQLVDLTANMTKQLISVVPVV